MANTRYTFDELSSAVAVGVFDAGRTVSIEIIDPLTDTLQTLTSSSCAPLTDDPETYVWPFSNLDTFPASFVQYEYIMSDDQATPVRRRELVDIGGWVSAISENLPAPDICKIKFNVFEADGSNTMSPDGLFDPNTQNYAELKTKYFANSRFFRTGKYKPSYDQINDGFGYWLMPQGAEIAVVVKSIGISETTITVPAASEANLNDLI